MSDHKCYKCGSASYEDGMMSGETVLGFKPYTAQWYSTGRPVAGRACLDCGFLEIYAQKKGEQISARNYNSMRAPGKFIFVVVLSALFIFIIVRSLFFEQPSQKPERTPVNETTQHNQ